MRQLSLVFITIVGIATLCSCTTNPLSKIEYYKITDLSIIDARTGNEMDINDLGVIKILFSQYLCKAKYIGPTIINAKYNIRFELNDSIYIIPINNKVYKFGEYDNSYRMSNSIEEYIEENYKLFDSQWN